MDPIHSSEFHIHDTGSICKALEMNPFKFYYTFAHVYITILGQNQPRFWYQNHSDDPVSFVF